MKLIFNAILAFFSYLVPKKPGLILFGAGNGSAFKGNTKYAYLHAIKSEQLQLTPVWITANTEVHDQLNGASYAVVTKGSFTHIWHLLRAQYICLEQSAKDVSFAGVLLGRFTLVQLWHGTPLKKISNDTYTDAVSFGQRVYQWLVRKELHGYALIPSPSATVSKTLSSGMNNNPNTQVLGYPRNDVLLAPERSFTDVHALLELSQYSKVFTYVPTFRDAESTMQPFTEAELLEIDAYLREANAVLLVKKHPRQQHLPIPESATHVIDISSQIDDIQELLPHCDALITDYSSVFFDYMLLNRPVLFYNYDLKEYLAKSREMYYEYSEVVPGPFATTATELLELMKNIDSWFADPTYKKAYTAIRDQFNELQDSDSAERVLQAIKKLK